MILGIGTDLVVVDELRRSMERTTGFRDRVFAPSETTHCLSNADPWSCFGARFAAKEAVMKALGTGWSQGVDFRDIVVTDDPSGGPRVVLFGAAAERVADRKGRMHLSMSFSGSTAFAVAVLEGRE